MSIAEGKVGCDLGCVPAHDPAYFWSSDVCAARLDRWKCWYPSGFLHGAHVLRYGEDIGCVDRCVKVGGSHNNPQARVVLIVFVAIPTPSRAPLSPKYGRRMVYYIIIFTISGVAIMTL